MTMTADRAIERGTEKSATSNKRDMKSLLLRVESRHNDLLCARFADRVALSQQSKSLAAPTQMLRWAAAARCCLLSSCCCSPSLAILLSPRASCLRHLFLFKAIIRKYISPLIIILSTYKHYENGSWFLFSFSTCTIAFVAQWGKSQLYSDFSLQLFVANSVKVQHTNSICIEIQLKVDERLCHASPNSCRLPAGRIESFYSRIRFLRMVQSSLSHGFETSHVFSHQHRTWCLFNFFFLLLRFFSSSPLPLLSFVAACRSYGRGFVLACLLLCVVVVGSRLASRSIFTGSLPLCSLALFFYFISSFCVNI